MVESSSSSLSSDEQTGEEDHGAAAVGREEGTSDTNSINTIDLAEEGPIRSMINHFQSFHPISPDHDNEAILIIRDHINKDDNTVERVLPATNLSTSTTKSTVRKAITKILSNGIYESDRLARVGDAMLKKWFLESNARRVFMYNSKQRRTTLICIGASEYQVELQQNMMSIDNLVLHLADKIITSSIPNDDAAANENECSEQIQQESSSNQKVNNTRV